MKAYSALTLAVLILCTHALAEEPRPASPPPAESIVPEPGMTARKLSDSECQALSEDPRLVLALEAAGSDGLQANFSTAWRVTSASGLPGSEVWVRLFSADGTAVNQSLVLQEGGQPESFFIHDVLETADGARTSSAEPSQNGFWGCGSWSGWTLQSTWCGHRFWCFGKNQKGIWKTWWRSRQCRNGVQVIQKDVFDRCGC